MAKKSASILVGVPKKTSKIVLRALNGFKKEYHGSGRSTTRNVKQFKKKKKDGRFYWGLVICPKNVACFWYRPPRKRSINQLV